MRGWGHMTSGALEAQHAKKDRQAIVDVVALLFTCALHLSKVGFHCWWCKRQGI